MANKNVDESPMMKQYRELKAKHPERVLLFRCGDFYEAYCEDAKECARILGVTLTWRTPSKRRAPGDYSDAMAGFPHHALDQYLPKLIRAGKCVAICDQLPEPPKTKVKRSENNDNLDNNNDNNNNDKNLEDKTMATKNNNQSETKNVQDAQVVNNEAIESVSVGEVSLNDIQPAIVTEEPKDDKPAVTMPLGGHGTLVIGGVPTTKSGRPSDRFDLEKEPKPKVTLKRKTPQPKAATLPTVRLVVYITSRTQQQAPRIEGFAGEEDPRWQRHYEEKCRLKALKADADKKNEKLRKQMKGKTKAEKEALLKKWVHVPSDPFNAGYFTDRNTGEKTYHMLMGSGYMDVAQQLVDAYNSGDEQAIAAAEQAVMDVKNGIVAEKVAERAARSAEREAAKAAKAPQQPAVSAEESAMFELFKKFMAGDPAAIAAMNEAMKAA